ncbi:MAG: hypothetical protein ACYTEQ_29565, partial [Planctomycetota bacterium]
MNRRLILLSVAVLAVTLAGRARGGDYYWTGSGTSWFDEDNWYSTPDGIPGEDDTAWANREGQAVEPDGPIIEGGEVIYIRQLHMP